MEPPVNLPMRRSEESAAAGPAVFTETVGVTFLGTGHIRPWDISVVKLHTAEIPKTTLFYVDFFFGRYSWVSWRGWCSCGGRCTPLYPQTSPSPRPAPSFATSTPTTNWDSTALNPYPRVPPWLWRRYDRFTARITHHITRTE